MKKIMLLILLAGLCGPACVRKKDKLIKPAQKVHVVDGDLGKGTTYDEEVGAFVLEDDANHDILAEASDTKKDEPQQVTKVQSDLDDAWAWQELDEEQPTKKIQFDYDSAAIRQDQDTMVRYDAQLAKTACEDGATIVIEGHSCLITRSQIYNQALSQKRAQVVKKRFIELGVPSRCIKAVGRGTACLITQDEGKEGQAPNRRAEVKFIYPQGEKSVKSAKTKHVNAQKTIKHEKKSGKSVKHTKKAAVAA